MSETGHLDSRDGLRLFFRLHRPESPQAAIVLVHGFNDHSGRYLHVLEALNQAGFAVLAFDCRGHGQSAGKRFHIDRFSDYVDDTERLLELARARMPGIPLFLMGHSQGGLIALTYALERSDTIDGLVVTAPACGLAMEVPAWMEGMAHLLGNALPALSIPSGLDPSHLTRDTSVVQAYIDDPLTGPSARARWYVEFRHAQARLSKEAYKVTTPLFALQGTSDMVTSPTASEQVFGGIGSADKTWKAYEGYYHAILNEPERDEILDEIVQWLRAHTG